MTTNGEVYGIRDEHRVSSFHRLLGDKITCCDADDFFLLEYQNQFDRPPKLLAVCDYKASDYSPGILKTASARAWSSACDTLRVPFVIIFYRYAMHEFVVLAGNDDARRSLGNRDVRKVARRGYVRWLYDLHGIAISDTELNIVMANVKTQWPRDFCWMIAQQMKWLTKCMKYSERWIE